MGALFDTLLPIVTLLLGAGWGNFLKRGELRNAMRLEAADQLAALPTRLWAKTGEDDWVLMNTAVDRLRVRLNLAGVPQAMSTEVAAAAREFWGDVHPVDADGETHWVVGSAANQRWTTITSQVGDYLGSSNAVKKRQLASKVSRRELAP